MNHWVVSWIFSTEIITYGYINILICTVVLVHVFLLFYNISKYVPLCLAAIGNWSLSSIFFNNDLAISTSKLSPFHIEQNKMNKIVLLGFKKLLWKWTDMNEDGWLEVT